ncbi:hypothetical protein [Halobacterium wangiae]|uniref:hypothetical protein n=1 Tax=Halobacterium wangiae TaxID=2902623 RepID=UPI001E6128B4|nr:hypothetical protein [Halobacterium wangiae]
MNVRDATDDDAESLVALASDDIDAERLIRDRTVRVAETDDGVAGFVAFDTWRGAVHVTRFDGESDVVGELLSEPRSFAAGESLPVEVVVPDGDEAFHEVLVDAGFEDEGEGPAFNGEETRRFRCRP